MADETFYRILFVGLYALFFSVRGYYRFVKPRTAGPEPVETDQKEFGIAEGTLSFAILGFFGFTILYLLNLDWFSWSQTPNYPELLRWAGVGLVLVSTPLLGWIHRTLDRQYSACLQIKESHLLITQGPYARVRHPMYTILNMFSFGVALVTANFFVIGFAFLVILPFPFIVRKEEQMMLDTFGDDYNEYMKSTGRFFPRIRST
ncbi:isoprenylcysteine carboxylmethyltransferase family protein [Candidatus Thorarchaeota archaeon]|nr:MAG: isoprenylcysteine carboxylmethyltransferase family protein [Candidatus Thorarchaeota archaeon]